MVDENKVKQILEGPTPTTVNEQRHSGPIDRLQEEGSIWVDCSWKQVSNVEIKLAPPPFLTLRDFKTLFKLDCDVSGISTEPGKEANYFGKKLNYAKVTYSTCDIEL